MRNVYITGAASGIGRALVQQLLAAGDRVLAMDVQAEALTSLAEQAGAGSDRLHSQVLDVRDASAWEALFKQAIEQNDCPDVLINVAGVLRHGYCWEITPEDLDLQFDVNAKGVILGTSIAARHMRERGSGHIINVASIAGITPAPGLPVYGASKFAVRGFSLSAAAELHDSGVAVTVVCPDAVRTPMLDQQQGHEQTALTFSGSRELTVEEVCDAIVDVAMKKRPMEVVLPLSRGVTAKAASLFPALVPALYASLKKKGLKQQTKYKKSDA